MNFGVIIVTYNRKSLLEECLSCVLRQSVPFFQVCVVDNCSTDGTGEYLDQLAARFKEDGGLEGGFLVFHLPGNRGGAGGFAFGLERMARPTRRGMEHHTGEITLGSTLRRRRKGRLAPRARTATMYS